MCVGEDCEENRGGMWVDKGEGMVRDEGGG